MESIYETIVVTNLKLYCTVGFLCVLFISMVLSLNEEFSVV